MEVIGINNPIPVKHYCFNTVVEASAEVGPLESRGIDWKTCGKDVAKLFSTRNWSIATKHLSNWRKKTGEATAEEP
jgi:hypothetical protein